jgi:hypothetical protein
VSGLFFWRHLQAEPKIPTDWLTADWHTKAAPRKRRRNVLPEAYCTLSKSDKRQVRAAAKWIFKRVSPLDWGRKMPDADAGKPLPKPVNLKDQVLPYVQGNWGSGVRKLTLTAIVRHLVDDDTCYFTANSLGDETILLIDIDCHSSGTLEGAKRFARHLKENYFPNLYVETSTHGNGAHGFLVVDKSFWTAAEYKGVLVGLEKWLKLVLRSTDFDVEDVEIKGTPMTVEWGSRRREARGVTYGSLAKMPRDWRRFGEWQSTTRMTAHELRRLPERFPVAEPQPEATPPVVRKETKGSVSGKLVDPDVIRRLEPLAREMLGSLSPQTGRSSRAVVVAEDLQVALAVLRACTLDMNADGSMPVMRVKALWDKAHEAGDTTRAFSFHRFGAIRNALSDMGLLEWEDDTYRFGKACKWKLGERLMGTMEQALSSTTIPSPSPILVCNMVAESLRGRPEQVGLRPKRVFPSELRTDWDSELVEAGLGWLSRTAA